MIVSRADSGYLLRSCDIEKNHLIKVHTFLYYFWLKSCFIIYMFIFLQEEIYNCHV